MDPKQEEEPESDSASIPNNEEDAGLPAVTEAGGTTASTEVAPLTAPQESPTAAGNEPGILSELLAKVAGEKPAAAPKTAEVGTGKGLIAQLKDAVGNVRKEVTAPAKT